MNRVCRHPLRLDPASPAWLSCDIHRADFLHHEDCPGPGSDGCAVLCANGTPTDARLLGMAVELLSRTPAKADLVGPCGAVPGDLARALAPLLNQPDGGTRLPEHLRQDLVAVARVLLGRSTP